MSRTAKEITNEILGKMPDNYNKSDGSVIYDLQAPVGEEMAGLEKTNDEILDNAFFDTADDEHKEKIAFDRANITRKPATYATGTVTITGEAGTAIPKGTQVASDFAIFDTIEDATVGEEGSIDVDVICETAGIIGNVPAEAIYEFPVTTSGLNEVTNEEATSGGYEIEAISDFAERYYAAIKKPVGAGTESDYEAWAMSVEGVAAARCFGRTPSVGYVTTYIMNSNHEAADAALIQAVHDYIETVRPCPAGSYVYSVSEVEINISVTVYISSGTIEDYEQAITDAIQAYIIGIGYSRDARRVSPALIAEAILQVEGVTDIDDLLVNGESAAIALSDTQIAVLGGVEIAEG